MRKVENNMLSNKAIDRFKVSSLDEKREIITLYFNAYKQATTKKYPLALRNLKIANSLWGNSELTILFNELLENYNLITFEAQIEEVLEHLIGIFAPSKG